MSWQLGIPSALLLPITQWMAPLVHSSPDMAVLLATAGLCLIALELNRPGLILPGAAGLLLLLFAGATLRQFPLHLWAVAVLAASASTLLANVWYRLPLWLLVAATLAGPLSLHFVVVAGRHRQVHLPVAVGCGLLLGGLGASLSRVAFRARRAKQVN